jgi:hypothetical protein
MTRLKIIGTGAAITLLLGGSYAAQQFGAQPQVTLDNPQQVVWDKPTTDEQWAEDVKKESFHIKSTGKLEEMRDTHAAKLQRVIDAFDEELNCEECLRFKLRKEHSDWTGEDLDNAYINRVAQATWEVEKLQQSVERMDNELRLRESGFVAVEGEDEGLFGSLTKPYAIRQIND